jgi:hypothetical protein
VPIDRAHRRFIGPNTHQPKLPNTVILRFAQDLSVSPVVTLFAQIIHCAFCYVLAGEIACAKVNDETCIDRLNINAKYWILHLWLWLQLHEVNDGFSVVWH